MGADLTVILTGLDESVEVERTLASIRETAGDAVEILFVDDASTDGFDYAGAARRHGAAYLRNESRLGCARSRDVGVEHIDTPNALLVDAHMRFRHDDWWTRIGAAIEDDPRAIYCTVCAVMKWEDETLQEGARLLYGARLQFLGDRFEDLLEAKWLPAPDPMLPIVDIPCVLGATYAFQVDYYHRLGGLLGLRVWGMDEPYLSLKAWLEGGRCRLLTDVAIGHKFKDGTQYALYPLHTYYNKLFVCETLLPRALGAEIRRRMAASAEHPEPLKRAEARIAEHADMLVPLRAHYAGLFTRSFDEVRALSDVAP